MTSLLIRREGQVLGLTLNRPQAGNQIDAALLRELTHAFGELPDDIACVTLSAAGTDFCMGREPSPPPSLAGVDASARGMAIRQFGLDPILACYARIREAPVPVIAFVQGLASGMGCALAASCDLVIAANGARFEAPELEKQFAPTLLMSALWARVPRAALLQMVLSMKPLDAPRAMSLGLVDEVVAEADFPGMCERWTAHMNSRAPFALRGIKAFLQQASAAPDSAVRTDAAANVLTGNMLSLLADLPAPAVGERHFADIHGERIAYLDQGRGDPLILLHSLGTSSALWQDVLPLLSAGRRVIAPDLRGHGQSTAYNEFSVDAIADDVIALADALKLPGFDLLGISMGGLIAVTVAARAPDRVRAVVLSSAYASVAGAKTEKRLALMEKFLGAVSMSTMARNYLEQTLARTTPWPVRERLAVEIAAMDKSVYLATARSISRHDVTALLPQVKCRTLVLNAEYDANVSASVSSLLAERIEGALEVQLPAAAHLACADQPAAYAEQVLRFLEPSSAAHVPER